MICVWGDLPREASRYNDHGIAEIQIAGKWFGATTQIGFVKESVSRLLGRYGSRSEQSMNGADWKAISHAVRIAFEVQDIVRNRELIFPLPYAGYLTEIKQGKIDFEVVQDLLDVNR